MKRAFVLLAAVVVATTLAYPATKPAPKPATWPPQISAEEMDVLKQVREIAVTLRSPCHPELTVAQHDSPVTLAMKAEIREMIVAGKGRRAIVAALVDKYGAGILPKEIATTDLALIAGVSIFALILLWAVWSHLRTRKRPEVLHLADARWEKPGSKAA
ncbi:MAG: cytochrome c-type biogenesis protein CcmH [Acidobacteria bacterium]|nr:cytochrome c-type biogenesis protein CcmH [Acidobacteriota bacterium]